jgi:ferric-dicitrate binding protein FerR (iron transport regulator)
LDRDSFIGGAAEDPPNGGATTEEEAAMWLARGRQDMTPDQERAWAEWLAADRANVDAFEAVIDTWRLLDKVRSEPSILLVREQALGARWRSRKRAYVKIAAIIAAIVVVVAVGIIKKNAAARGTVVSSCIGDHKYEAGRGECAL